MLKYYWRYNLIINPQYQAEKKVQKRGTEDNLFLLEGKAYKDIKKYEFIGNHILQSIYYNKVHSPACILLLWISFIGWCGPTFKI